VAKLRYHLKRIFPEGDIMEIKIWEIPKSEDFPEGVKYSLAYIKGGRRRVLGYDNERGKGHHKHYFDREEEIEFEDWEKLVREFLEDVKKLRRDMYES
jgi:hypothetical protein